MKKRLLAALVVLSGCDTSLSDADLARATETSVEAWFNFAGTRHSNAHDLFADDALIQMIDRSAVSVDVAVMGFARQEIIDALIRAHRRGVDVRMVGDARHMAYGTPGYQQFEELGIPLIVGNQNHIMHNKFFVIDDRFVFAGTGNITTTDLARNDNNFVLIDSPQVAADFGAEFNQLFAGRFGATKQRVDNGNRYIVGDSIVEVHFSPQEDTMGRILQAIEAADESIEFTIFAFTKDQVGSALIERHLAFETYNACCDPARGLEADPALCAPVQCEEPFVARHVRGVIDRSQLHSNGPYHEIYRLLAYGVDVRLDGNENSALPGDYQAGGGRLHAKTIVIDAGRPDATVVTGSFNWSASATQSNDETLIVIESERLAPLYRDFFETLWAKARFVGNARIGVDGLEAGDVIFNEIHWDGYNGDLVPGSDEYVDNDEFIELLNTTDEAIDLSLWTVTSGDDFVLGFYPGTIIGPRERFLIVDHLLTPFDDRIPQSLGGAFVGADFVMNTANDPRYLRLNLHNLALDLSLVDPDGAVMDSVGDGGPPFFGGREEVDGHLINRSMERLHFDCDGAADCERFGDGRDPASWAACEFNLGGNGVRAEYQEIVIATPAEPNSGGEVIGQEDPTFRWE